MTGFDAPSAVRLAPAWRDPDRVVEIVRSAGPFWPLANYAANEAEMAALGARRNVVVPPWFRQDFAREGRALVSGADELLGNPAFVDAAHAVYGPGCVVRPTTVYVNIMGATPFPFPPHLDVPAFAGFTRADHPIWLLKVMKTSGLFEAWRTRIATAVSWFYDGPGGVFHYWPNGPEGPAHSEVPPFRNVAVVADNEATFHGVGPLGPPGARLPEGLTGECRLVRAPHGWDVVDPEGAVVVHLADDEVRITVSWKADVFADAHAAALHDAGEGRLAMETVVERFAADLRDRGIDVPRPHDPHADQAWTAALARAYRDPAPAIA